MRAERIARLLPEIYQSAIRPGSVLETILGVMEALHQPAEEALAGLDAQFDPRRASEPFVNMLAAWLALGYLLGGPDTTASGRRGRAAIDIANMRELAARAAELARERGTLGSLRTILELATGVPGFEIVEGADSGPHREQSFAATVVVPAAAAHARPLIELIINREKPAFTTVRTLYPPAQQKEP